MYTKEEPGRFDCYANAEPDEPMFILLGRDPLAPYVVEMWAYLRRQYEGGQDVHNDKAQDADKCAAEMKRYLSSVGRRTPMISTDITYCEDVSMDELKGRGFQRIDPDRNLERDIAEHYKPHTP